MFDYRALCEIQLQVSVDFLRVVQYVTHIVGEPKYKYDQQAQVTRSCKELQHKYCLETVSIKILVLVCVCVGGGGLNQFYGIRTSPLRSAVLHYKCNITHNTE